MLHKRFSCENGWVVVVVQEGKVLQVHSTGYMSKGNDDRASNWELMNIIRRDMSKNQLHSQQTGHGGVRWPEE